MKPNYPKDKKTGKAKHDKKMNDWLKHRDFCANQMVSAHPKEQQHYLPPNTPPLKRELVTPATFLSHW